MGTNSAIEWTHHTFNPWRGCTKVSAGCANCYAETLSKRNPQTLGVWGKSGKRVIAAESYWRKPIAWNKAAEKAGERHRVFCASLADVFEGPESMPADSLAAVRAARLRLFDLVRQTPSLDWLLLTKRPENVIDCVRQAALDCDRPGDLCEMLNCWSHGGRGSNAPDNVWLGTSVENQATADERIPHLLRVPAAVRFLSCEPLLGAIDMRYTALSKALYRQVLRNYPCDESKVPQHLRYNGPPSIDWAIIGGESGPGARPCDVAWIRGIVQQCKAAAVPAFVKQLGAHVIETSKYGPGTGKVREGKRKWRPYEFVGGSESMTLKLRDSKGGSPDEWPEDLRVREFPLIV